MRGRRHDRRERELVELDHFRLVRRAADEDITRFGEELAALHLDTLGTVLDEQMRTDYQRALDDYEQAKAALARATTTTDVTAVTSTLADGRFHHACVLAGQAGLPRPERRPPCFFDPAHGPGSRDVEWAPVGGVARSIPVCFRDAERLLAGERPDTRLVRLGDRRAAWYDSGPAYAAWASGWYADLVSEGRFEAGRLTMAFVRGTPGTAGSQLPLAAGWTDPGAWTDAGMIGGHDYSGWVEGGGHWGDGGVDGGSGGGFGGGGDAGGGGGGD